MSLRSIKFCTICRENSTEYYTMCCGQSYHPECLYDWLHVNNVCPISRTKVEVHIRPVLKHIIEADEYRDTLLWSLQIRDTKSFCSICYFPVNDNVSCNGWRYHPECIKNLVFCPECEKPIDNSTIFKMWKNLTTGNIFHENYLDHAVLRQVNNKAPYTFQSDRLRRNRRRGHGFQLIRGGSLGRPILIDIPETTDEYTDTDSMSTISDDD